MSKEGGKEEGSKESRKEVRKEVWKEGKNEGKIQEIGRKERRNNPKRDGVNLTREDDRRVK